MNLEVYKNTFDQYDEKSNNYWNSKLFKVDQSGGHWEHKPERCWIRKVVRWYEGKYRIDRVSAYLLTVSEKLTKDYLSADEQSKSTLELYLIKCRHMLSHFQKDVMDVHNDRCWFRCCKIDTGLIESRVKAILLSLNKPSNNASAPTTLNYEKIFPVHVSAIGNRISLVKDIVLAIFSNLSKEDLLHCSRVNRTWRAMIKADPLSAKIPELKSINHLCDLFSRRVLICTHSPLLSVVPTGIDSFLGSTAEGDLKQIDLLGNHKTVLTARAYTYIKALNETHVVLFGERVLQVFDHKTREVVWDIQIEDSNIHWDSITPISAKKFLGFGRKYLSSSISQDVLYCFDLEKRENHYIAEVPPKNNWFVFADNTKCFINLSKEKIVVVSLEDYSETVLAQLTPNEHTHMVCYSDNYAVIYKVIQRSERASYEIWSLENFERVKTIPNGPHSPQFLDQNTLIFIEQGQLSHDKLKIYYIPTDRIQSISYPYSPLNSLSQKIASIHIATKNQVIIVSHSTLDKRQQSIRVWNRPSHNLQLIWKDIIHFGYARIQRLKENLWVTKSPRLYLLFNDSEEFPTVIANGSKLSDITLNGDTVLISPFKKERMQTILKLA